MEGTSLVTLQLAGKTLSIPMEDMFHLPYFHSWSRCWTKGEIITLPPLDVFQNDLSLISELLSFAKNRPTKLPTSHKRTFQLLCLADFLRVEGFVSFVADKLSVEPDRLVCGPIRNIRELVRGRYRQHQHGRAVTDLMKCSFCNLSITNDAPAKAEWFEIPCCNKFLHLHCKESCASNPVCPGCGKHAKDTSFAVAKDI